MTLAPLATAWSAASSQGRYRQAVWAIAPLWSALVLLLPQVRSYLYTGLEFYGMEPSWWRAGLAAAVVGGLFVMISARFHRAFVSPSPVRRQFAALGGLLLGYWVFSALFVLVCLVERDGLSRIATPLSLYMFPVAWPLTGLVLTIILVPLEWLAAVALALVSVQLLYRADSVRRAPS